VFEEPPAGPSRADPKRGGEKAHSPFTKNDDDPIPFTLVRNEVGSPSMDQLNEQPWRVEATYQLPRLEKERVHIYGVTLALASRLNSALM
jgi:hypothetical protein